MKMEGTSFRKHSFIGRVINNNNGLKNSVPSKVAMFRSATFMEDRSVNDSYSQINGTSVFRGRISLNTKWRRLQLVLGAGG